MKKLMSFDFRKNRRKLLLAEGNDAPAEDGSSAPAAESCCSAEANRKKPVQPD